MKKFLFILVILVFGSGIIIAKEMFSGKVPEDIVFVGDSIMNSSKQYIGLIQKYRVNFLHFQELLQN